jgi:hypothetical protein
LLSDARAEVGAFVSNAKNNDTAAGAIELQSLETKLTSWYTKLPAQLQYSPDSLLWQPQMETAPAFIFMHILYRTSLALLYYSLVLSYAGRTDSSSSVSSSLLTSRAIDHADAISEILANLLGQSRGISRADGFWAYSAYIATTVQLSYLWSRSPDRAASAKQNIGRNLRFLKDVGPYWAVAEQLVFP